MEWHALSIGGTEWVIIIFAALVLILGTGRLPGAAKKIGRAVNEYNRAKDGIGDHIKQIQGGAGEGAPKIGGPVESEREKLEVMARAAGMNPDGKSDGELREAIAQRMGVGGPAAAATTGTGADSRDTDASSPHNAGKHDSAASTAQDRGSA